MFHPATATHEETRMTSSDNLRRPARRALSTAAAVLLLALSIGIAACCGDETDGRGNAADAAFAADMAVHHEGAIEMAQLAVERGERDEIQQLAQDIIAAQEAEIETMERLRAELPEPDEADRRSPGEMGMEMDAAMLEDAKPFDKAFIEMMVPHHEGAIDMAEELRAEGEHPELQAMAADIISSQRAEIDQMREWYETSYGELPATDGDPHGGH
jgi:uncharacterized protein (DUF305 family)